MKKTIVFIILFILVFSSFSFATNEFDEYKYFAIFDSGNIKSIVTSNYRITYKENSGIYGMRLYYLKDGKLTKTDDFSSIINFNFPGYKIPIFSNYDIFYHDSTDVFFSPPVPTIPEIIQELPKNLFPTIQVLGGTGILIISLMIFFKPLQDLLKKRLIG